MSVKRVLLGSLCALAGFLLVLSAPAFGAGPETPEAPEVEVVEAIKATEARFHGTISPKVMVFPVEAGTYQFIYRPSTKDECKGAGEILAPPSPSVYFGVALEPVFETVGGLSAGSQYAVCLRIETTGGGEAVSVPLTFETATPPEAPLTASPAQDVTATTAKLEGTLNPDKEVMAGYYFAYEASATECTSGGATALESEAKVKAEKVTAALSELEPNTEYTFCLVARNAAEETTPGNTVSFKTAVSKPTVIGESVTGIRAKEVELEAVVNPSNESTECHFQYGEKIVSEHEVPCEQQGALGHVVPAPILEGGQQGVILDLSGLKQNTTYHYQVLLKNRTGETGQEAEVTTALHPETPRPEPASQITTTSATLNGVLNPKAPGNPGSYEFYYRQSASECEGGQRSGGSALGEEEEAVQAEVNGLLPGATYTFCLLARNAAGETALGSPTTFTTVPLAVTIESESSPDVSATEARLEAKINPGGGETAYHFEYGPAAGSYAASVPIPSGEIAGTLTGKSVSAVLTSLTPGTTYHYRVVAANALPGDVDGPDQTFTTLAAVGSGSPPSCPNEQLRAEQPYGLTLPDCRAYELVSPAEKNGSDATDPFADSTTRASVSGEAITYDSRGSFAEPAGASYEDQFLSRRGPDGWSTQSITLPYKAYQTAGLINPYRGLFFTPELSEGLAITDIPLTGESPPVWELYMADFANGSYRWLSRPSTGTEPYLESVEGAPLPLAASTDLSHVVFDEGEWVNGRAIPIAITNNGKDIVGSVIGSGDDVWHAVSADGSRVFLSSLESCGFGCSVPTALYVRENIEEEQSAIGAKGECTEPAKACTVEVSAGAARFWGASADGSTVFYTEGEDLHRYEVESGHTTAITSNGKVQGVVQISEDGSYVYFVAEGVLSGKNAEEHEPVAGQPNLYVSHEGGAPTFIATLAKGQRSGNGQEEIPGDESDWGRGFPQADPETNTAAVTLDGTRLAFESERSLTDYDNELAESSVETCDEIHGERKTNNNCQEIYLYDAETSRLVCASCNPSGARPIGPSSLRTGSQNKSVGASYRPRDFSEAGTLFFDSYDALVPHASDGRQNVYEFENGHVYPISDVAGGDESFFLDASANGENVFFGTADQLVAQDRDNRVDVYDARVGGGFSAPGSAPQCDNGDSCKPPATPQPGIFGAPASATFSGAGNITPVVSPAAPKKTTKKTVKCKKSLVKNKQGRCVKSKSKAKRPGRNRRGK
jgi:hypothetical protein